MDTVKRMRAPGRPAPRPGRHRAAALLLGAAAVATTSACTAEYHGDDSGIDGVLWRQIASFEDPLSQSIYGPLDDTIGIRHTLAPEPYPPAVDDPAVYLAGLDAGRWDGAAATVPQLGLEEGGAILYEEAVDGSTASFSVFISSGPRSDTPRDDGSAYDVPSEVYTCYRLSVVLSGDGGGVDRAAFT